MKKLKMLTIATLLAAPLAASANGFYVGANAGYGLQNIDDELKGLSTKDQLDASNTGVGQLKVGYDFNDYLGLEMRAGAANKDSEMLHHYSAYAKAQYPVSDSFSVYGLLGGTDARMSDAIQAFGVDKNLQSVSYAVGGRLAITDSMGMTLEYNQISSHKDYELGAVNLGVDYKF
ncbi:MAG: porin family protein [Psychromonas sp.]